MSDPETLLLLLPQLVAVDVASVAVVDGTLVVAAATHAGPAPCTGCHWFSEWAHSAYERHVLDEAVGGRPVRIDLTVRRLYCENPDCPKARFAEQVPGLTRRYQRRTPALQKVVDALALALAGSAGSRLLAVLHHALSWMSVLNSLMRVALPERVVPEVIGIDEFALRKGQRYASVIIDAVTGARVEVLADRAMSTVTKWLRAHPGARFACRDGAAGYAQAITDADQGIRQVADRWHLWHGLSQAARKEVAAHSGCWGTLGPPIIEGKRAATTRERWAQVHDLRAKGVGLLECARRLNVSLNTIKRYDRAPEPEAMIRAPIYRPTLVDSYRDHLRKRRAEDPAVPLTHLLGEITALGYTGSANLLMRYIAQGRVEAEHAALSPKKATGLLLADSASLREDALELREKLGAACPEMTELSALIGRFAAMLTPKDANAERLGQWITRVRAANLPTLGSYATGLERDQDAVQAALTLPYHNGRTEGVNQIEVTWNHVWDWSYRPGRDYVHGSFLDLEAGSC